jgi:hypothetical protein
MADLLEKAKNRVDRRFLGHAGIHGVGLRRSQSAVVIYVDPSHQSEVEPLLEEVRAQAAPYNIIVVQSAPAVGI